MTLLEDRSHLLRESAIRLRRFEQQGYKRGLDAMNEKVDAEGLLQKPFTTGFLKGAKKGWNEMVLKGMIASLACFTFKHERHLLEQQNAEGSETKELVQHIITINNDINESVSVAYLQLEIWIASFFCYYHHPLISNIRSLVYFFCIFKLSFGPSWSFCLFPSPRHRRLHLL